MNSFYMETSAKERVDVWRREAEQTARARQLPLDARRLAQSRSSRTLRLRLLMVVVIASVVVGLLQAFPAAAS